ncbi:hypothetical protein ACE1CD_15720 [Aerosakkonema sp. BLCC-F183]|uniref:hypothetical protein n=1 Tax=Aerosakkonema sp. BLCC-F183 TaxID=3342834 RepID=UPI0035B724A3
MSYGWCQSCRDRIGKKLFRELTNRRCADCIKKFGATVLPLKPSKPIVKTTPGCNKPAKKGRPIQKLSTDEEILLNWLRSNSIQTYWKSKAANSLGWPVEKVRKISRKLRNKKLFTFSRISLSETILDFLTENNPKTAYELSKEMPAEFNPSWVREILHKLSKEGKVLLIKSSSITKPHTYLLKKENETVSN